MKRDDDPGQLLHGLLDRHEKQSNRSRRIIARPAQAFASSTARELLIAGLIAAQDSGAVLVEWDRDASHLIARVILADAGKLYRHLDRTPAPERDASAVSLLTGYAPATEIGLGLRDAFSERWAAGMAYLSLSSDAVDEALSLIRAADAAFRDFDTPVPLRTRSTRLLGDSKALERNLAKLLSHLRQSGQLSPTLERGAALDALGLSKFPQPVLLAGQLVLNEIELPMLPYIGLPPEVIGDVALLGPVRALLTIENLESFHRQIREKRGAGEIIVYCGGFPAQGVLHTVRHLARLAGLAEVRHWGDIDPGGVRIGRYLETALDLEIIPHLMEPGLARKLGRHRAATGGLGSVPDSSRFGSLARFLASDDAYWLEQEVLEPIAIP